MIFKGFQNFPITSANVSWYWKHFYIYDQNAFKIRFIGRIRMNSKIGKNTIQNVKYCKTTHLDHKK